MHVARPLKGVEDWIVKVWRTLCQSFSLPLNFSTKKQLNFLIQRRPSHALHGGDIQGKSLLYGFYNVYMLIIDKFQLLRAGSCGIKCHTIIIQILYKYYTTYQTNTIHILCKYYTKYYKNLLTYIDLLRPGGCWIQCHLELQLQSDRGGGDG